MQQICFFQGAITAMTKAMAIDEAENHVRVNSISPGNVWTPMWSDLADGTQNPSSEKERGRQAQVCKLTSYSLWSFSKTLTQWESKNVWLNF